MRLLRRGDRRFARQSATPLLSSVFISLVFAGSNLLATDRVWTGGTSTDWATNGNWQGGTQPGSTDNAVFNSTFSNQPNLAVNKTIGGVWMTGSIGQNVTISGASTLTLAGGTINGQTGLGILIDNANAFTLTINCLLKLNGAQSWLNNSSNLFTVGGAVNTNSNALTISGSGNTTISGVTSGTGSLTKTGTGTLILSGLNTYTGGTNLNGGLLQVASTETAGTSGPLGKSGTISFGGGTLQYSSSNQFDYSGRFSTAVNQAYSVDTNGQNVTWATALTSSGGSLTKLGTGTLTLSAVGTYTGTTTIQNGTLKLGIASAIPNTGLTITATGTGVTATLDLNNFNETLPSLTLGGTTSTSTATVTTGTGILTLGGNVTYDATNNPAGATISGKVDLGSSARTFTVGDSSSAATDLSVSAVISGTGGLTKAGAGTMALSGANSYSGVTTINAGTLSVSSLANGGSNSNLGSSSNAATNLILNGGTLSYTGAAISTDRLFSVGTSGGTLDGSGSGAVNFTNVSAMAFNGQTGTRTLTLTGTNTGNNTIAAVIGDNTGATSLVKSGAGKWQLTGSNTFSGATTINGGTLVAAGSSGSALGSTSSITVNSGGTFMLGANNQINNSAGVTLNSGTFSVGGFTEGSAIAVGMGALTLSANSHIDFGTGAAGLLSFSSFTANLHTLTIDNWTGTVGLAGSLSTDRLIFDSDQSSNLNLYTFTGYVGAMEIALSGGFYEIVPVATPEPATWAAGVLVVAGLAWHRKKQLRACLTRIRLTRILSPVRARLVSLRDKFLPGFRATRSGTSTADNGIEIFAHH